jgi:uncharacterized protein (TIGR03437 family)
VAFHADFSAVTVDVPARVGEVIILFASGYGTTVPASVTGAQAGRELAAPAAPVFLQIGQRQAETAFVGQTPGTTGVLQLNVRVPMGIPAGSASVLLRIGATESQAGFDIAVR